MCGIGDSRLGESGEFFVECVQEELACQGVRKAVGAEPVLPPKKCRLASAMVVSSEMICRHSHLQ
jgi:hypothetical protein